jgi:predicted transcriptional regulator
MWYNPNEEFLRIIEHIKKNGTSQKMTVRTFLAYFGQERRNKNIVRDIKEHLNNMEIDVLPDFTSVWIDAEIEIKPKATIPARKSINEESEVDDPIPRLKMLTAANRLFVKEIDGIGLVTVTKETALEFAVTQMLLYDYSQLPVMPAENSRTVNGMISWKSIGKAIALGKKCTFVQDCMEPVEVLSNETPLFDAVKVILSKEVILVMANDKSITGVVTITDIGEQFIKMSEPFLILEQIENHIRNLLNGKFTFEQLKEYLDSGDASRELKAISDLNFGEYVRILENPKNWSRLELTIDRSLFVKRLDEVRKIRNDVMHFDPDGISEKKLDMLRQTAQFFYMLQTVRKKR